MHKLLVITWANGAATAQLWQFNCRDAADEVIAALKNSRGSFFYTYIFDADA